jgi:hypothetical protein
MAPSSKLREPPYDDAWFACCVVLVSHDKGCPAISGATPILSFVESPRLAQLSLLNLAHSSQPLEIHPYVPLTQSSWASLPSLCTCGKLGSGKAPSAIRPACYGKWRLLEAPKETPLSLCPRLSLPESRPCQMEYSRFGGLCNLFFFFRVSSKRAENTISVVYSGARPGQDSM